MMTEETEFDEVITCDHSYDKRCHTSYVTTFQAQQEEECEENFKKVCMIEYESKAYNETLEICSTEIVKDCEKEGPKVCRTVYESSCATRNIEHEVSQSSLVSSSDRDVVVSRWRTTSPTARRSRW